MLKWDVVSFVKWFSLFVVLCVQEVLSLVGLRKGHEWRRIGGGGGRQSTRQCLVKVEGDMGFNEIFGVDWLSWNFGGVKTVAVWYESFVSGRSDCWGNTW